MTQKTLSPALANLLGGTIYDLSMDLATMESPLSEAEIELYLEHHALEFLRADIARNSVVQSEILFAALEEDFHTPSPYETMDTIPNLMTLKRGNLTIEGVIWNRLIGHFFERFLQRVKLAVLGQ